MSGILREKYSKQLKLFQKTEHIQQYDKIITTTSGINSKWNVTLIPCLDSNYVFILWHTHNRQAVVVDVPDSKIINDFLENQALTLAQIWITHHHHDHIGGLKDLLHRVGERKNKPMIFYPLGEADKIEPLVDNYMLKAPLKGQDTFNLPASPSAQVTIIDVSGHTKGHIAYFIQEKRQAHKPLNRAFVGDALFSLGCGRLFEGTAQQMKESLDRLTALPDDTQIFCSHEYTASNGKFALSIDPDNLELHVRIREVEALIAEKKPSIPTIIEREKQTNPFLRLSNRRIRQNLGLDNQMSDVEVFRVMRLAKDKF